MATVSGPLMSLDARGQIGKALIYSNNKGRATVKSYASPAQPNTLDQRYARASIALINTIWQNISQSFCDEWTPLAEPEGITGFNKATQTMMDELQNLKYPLAAPTFPPTTPTVNTSTFTGSAGPNSISGEVNLTGPSSPDDYVSIALQIGFASPVNRLKWALVTFTGLTQATFPYQITNLAPNDYRQRGFLWRPNGSAFNVTGPLGVIVT